MALFNIGYVDAYTLMVQLLSFIAWSGLLTAVLQLVAKYSSVLKQWSRLWLLAPVVALLPFAPWPAANNDTLIPQILTDTWFHSTLNVINHSVSAQHDFVHQPVALILLNLVGACLVIGSIYSLWQFGVSIYQISQFKQRSTAITDFSAFSPAQQVTLNARNIEVRITSRAISPCVFGLFKHCLILPHSVFKMPQTQRLLLIEHELIHIKRRDPQALILMRLCTVLCWFNPFIAHFERRFLQTMELNTDSAVLANYPANKLAYAQTLIASIRLSSNRINNAMSPSFSAAHCTKQDFEDRLRSAMSGEPSICYNWRYRLILAVAAGLLVLFAGSVRSGIYSPTFSQDIIASQWPVPNARISSTFEQISDFRGRKPHQGIDFAAPLGSDVLASFSGRVTLADDVSLHQNYGNVVLIEHGDNQHSLYAHLDSFNVKPGQWIFAGQKLGSVGKTGRVTGPHLHFEMLQDGHHINPADYLDLTR